MRKIWEENSTCHEQLTTWQKFSTQKRNMDIPEISRVEEDSLRKKKREAQYFLHRLWTSKLIFLEKDSGWIIWLQIKKPVMHPDLQIPAIQLEPSLVMMWGLSQKVPILLLGILWGILILAKVSSFTDATQAFPSVIKNQAGRTSYPLSQDRASWLSKEHHPPLVSRIPVLDSRIPEHFPVHFSFVLPKRSWEDTTLPGRKVEAQRGLTGHMRASQVVK